MALEKTESGADFSKRFEKRILSGLGRPRGLFLAAVSGGADSTAMAGVLAGNDAPAFSVHCVHINHGIRSANECAGDEEAVTALCGRLSLTLTVRRVPPGAVAAWARLHGTGLEAAARHFRYGALQSEARRLGANAILVAHTLDDRLENTLMAVLRGSGPAGLGAFRPKTPLRAAEHAAVPIIRPMLASSRAEVLAYLAARGLSWREDPSNADTRFFRNRVRHALVPLLDREFPHWRGPLLRLGETQAMAADFLAAEAGRRLPFREEDGALFVSAAAFFAEEPIIREEALFSAMDALASRPDFRPDPAPGAEPPESLPAPRRDAVRPFVYGTQSARDAGAFRLERKNGRISVRAAAARNADFAGEEGGFFSLLITKPGVYTPEGAKLPPFSCARAGKRPGGEGPFFYAGLPLVLRALEEKAGIIEARDAEGRAALLDTRGVPVWKRNTLAAFYFVFGQDV